VLRINRLECERNVKLKRDAVALFQVRVTMAKRPRQIGSYALAIDA